MFSALDRTCAHALPGKPNSQVGILSRDALDLVPSLLACLPSVHGFAGLGPTRTHPGVRARQRLSVPLPPHVFRFRLVHRRQGAACLAFGAPHDAAAFAQGVKMIQLIRDRRQSLCGPLLIQIRHPFAQTRKRDPIVHISAAAGLADVGRGGGTVRLVGVLLRVEVGRCPGVGRRG
jgi:hypothetical protein